MIDIRSRYCDNHEDVYTYIYKLYVCYIYNNINSIYSYISQWLYLQYIYMYIYMIRVCLYIYIYIYIQLTILSLGCVWKWVTITCHISGKNNLPNVACPSMLSSCRAPQRLVRWCITRQTGRSRWLWPLTTTSGYINVYNNYIRCLWPL